ncbi:ATP-dependent DNA helicase RecG [Saccharicrinis carchari]|uniref:ATP-dependent DNA helicase RecG n=1 Tax=Saccharicrinis carchari TaxID=1168039 RepID=A0A521AIL2_SACCC|nr:ATP-dependent DNA helicase RecG [Saccharicrinis carchari]SMO34656.1 ATP-dependent DNA helicase RecG [Saccharicrinis carchari]
MSELSTKDITYLPGVGPKRAELLKKELKIQSYEDLLYHFPYKYVDRSRTYKIGEISSTSSHIQLRGKVISLNSMGQGRSQRLVAKFADDTGVIELVWFKYIKQIKSGLDPKAEYIIFGKPSKFNQSYNIVHPEMEKVDSAKPKITFGLQAFYNTTEKMKNSYLNSKTIQKMQQNIFLSFQGALSESLPAYIIQQYKLMLLDKALRTIHFPADSQVLQQAQFRLKFEELFYIQLSILRLKTQRKLNISGHTFTTVGDYFNHFFHHNLPFELTGAQKRVIREIRHDVGSGRQMNRLLQGDVGSGKTMVALMVMLIALDNNFQTCLMAPTEILASQHFDSIIELLQGMDLNVKLLTGSSKKKDREQIHAELQSGKLQILIGTHALLEDVVKFKNLGMVIIDEQHRFGVAQRARLWKKNSIPPHVLVMTATPIPRTLAMTVYGDLDVSVIDELPPGRKPIQTKHYFHNHRNNLNRFIKAEIDNGRQIYVVYPLIEESEKMDYKNLAEGLEYMQSAFPEYTTAMVHGKMKPAEKDAAMQEFTSGRAHILVATTVIEVGVNVPNASVMVIESAERFGLSQLHQLRGRVGRGVDQSYCILMTGHKLGEDSKKRMSIMVDTNDGFEIAEADMKLRGPGDMEGTQQSGLPFDLKIANLTRDSQLLQHARNVANAILDKDPTLENPENQILKRQLTKLARQKLNWSLIS